MVRPLGRVRGAPELPLPPGYMTRIIQLSSESFRSSRLSWSSGLSKRCSVISGCGVSIHDAVNRFSSLFFLLNVCAAFGVLMVIHLISRHRFSECPQCRRHMWRCHSTAQEMELNFNMMDLFILDRK